ncbi:MAG: hypothetical protein IRZ03_13215 [Acidobacterium ailaaui]|nr:hypothetical protein [Pseudacidobacterium ailaaui]
MTVKELYEKYKSGNIPEKRFIYEISRLNVGVSNLNSINDTLNILKSKGFLNEEKKSEDKFFNFEPFEYFRGLQYELDKMGSYDRVSFKKAKDKVMKNLKKDPQYYYNKLIRDESPYLFKEPENYKDSKKFGPDGYTKKEYKPKKQ